MNNKGTKFISIIYCALLIWYSYLEMTALEMAERASSFLAITKVSVILISLYLLLIKGGVKYRTSFSKYWFAWILFLLFEFLLFFIHGGGGMSFLHNFFAPFCFLLVFSLCLTDNYDDSYLVLGFVLLYLFTGGYSLFLSFTYNAITIEAGRFVSNLVFWPLCSFVFVTLIKNNTLKYILFIPMIIITLLLAKRSAMIIVFLEILVFSFAQFRSARNRGGKRSLLLYFAIGFMALGIVSSRFSKFTDSSLSRFDTMQEDQGSGRVEIYDVALRNIENFSVMDVLVGRGYGSIKEVGNTNAHNDAIQLFYEFGLGGLIFYIVFLILLYKRLKKVKRFAEEYYVGYVFCFITILVLGMFSNLIPFNSYFAFLCSYLGMTEAAIYKRTHAKQINVTKSAA